MLACIELAEMLRAGFSLFTFHAEHRPRYAKPLPAFYL
jgi:hypothetical protein